MILSKFPMKRSGEKPEIYGVTWDGSSTTLFTRTGDAALFVDPNPAVSADDVGSSPFDDIMPWSGIEKVEDSEAGTLVKIPKFWYKLTKNGDALSIQITNVQISGFFVSPAHADRGDGKGERDYVYIGRYHCGLRNDLKSESGYDSEYDISRSDARTSIHNLGTTIWQADLAMRQTIWFLYLVEFANWDSQAAIGGGCSLDGDCYNNGATDSMVYHTGNLQGSHSAYGACQYRWIEGLWDNYFDWVDGCYNDSNGLNVIMNPANFSDTENGTLIGKPPSYYPYYPSAIGVAIACGCQWIYPTALDGSQSTHIPDNWKFYTTKPCVHSGGCAFPLSQANGLFRMEATSVDASNSVIVPRLMKLP